MKTEICYQFKWFDGNTGTIYDLLETCKSNPTKQGQFLNYTNIFNILFGAINQQFLTLIFPEYSSLTFVKQLTYTKGWLDNDYDVKKCQS